VLLIHFDAKSHHHANFRSPGGSLHPRSQVHIMVYMSGKATALLGIISAAAVGIYFQLRRPRRALSDVRTVESQRIEIDDDSAADIIKRARPALERARELYAW